MSELTTEATVYELGTSEECFVGIALLGIDASKRRYLATLHTKAEVELWLSAHEGSYIDPEQWRGVVVGTRRGRIQPTMRQVSAEDWNRGVRWGELKY